jgi:hypothetical protein
MPSERTGMMLPATAVVRVAGDARWLFKALGLRGYPLS